MKTKHQQIEFIRRQYLGGRNPLRTDRSKLGVKCFESAENWNYILSQATRIDMENVNLPKINIAGVHLIEWHVAI